MAAGHLKSNRLLRVLSADEMAAALRQAAAARTSPPTRPAVGGHLVRVSVNRPPADAEVVAADPDSEQIRMRSTGRAAATPRIQLT
ncbi:MAG: hypothetical protein K2X82_14690 [Gemmataceae bacterium]|nr:hypothetical protein [Gemmataceae bacterium]